MTTYALFDTDYISKMHLIHKDEQNRLIDRIMDIPNYTFCCHSRIRDELALHTSPAPFEWLNDRISSGKIVCYADSHIIDRLTHIYGNSACAMYLHLLKTACEVYSRDYFNRYYSSLHYRLPTHIFLHKLYEAELLINNKNNLGEIKTFVLLQFLSLTLEEPILVFCSDDRNARAGIISIGGATCISVLSSFIHLRKELDFQWSDAQPYVQSFLDFCQSTNQLSFRIQTSHRSNHFSRIPCAQVMCDIYDDKLLACPNGYLRYS